MAAAESLTAAALRHFLLRKGGRKDMKIGRNAPCPCGSGKKYKKCCLPKKVTAQEDLDYRRLSEAYNRLFDDTVEYAERVFGEKTLQMALLEYLLWPDEDERELDAGLIERQMPLFWPWFVFNWEYVYDPMMEEVELDVPSGRTPAELYAEKQGSKLGSLERKLIEAVNRKPFSFYEVLEVESGKQILLQDILAGGRIMVQERSGSRHLKPSDIVFGRAVSLEGVGMIMGLATYAIPPGHKPAIIELRRRMKAEEPVISDQVLNDWDFEIRELYLAIDHALFTRPRIYNSDGDPFEFHKLVYDIDSAEEAFEKLASLCVTMEAGELREQAERDAHGRIRRAEITWDRKGHKAGAGLTSTTLGRIFIEGGRLTAEVNSAQRAETLREKIEAGLGSGARFRVDEIRSLEKMMQDREQSGQAARSSAEHEALMQEPEVRRQVAQIIRQHWEDWVDMELPALGGKTPREAVRDEDGVEAVEALLADVERHGQNDPYMKQMNRDGVRLVRELLGMPKPAPEDR